MTSDIKKNILYTILLPIVALFFGLALSFILIRSLPGDPVLAYLQAIGIPFPTQPQYLAALQQLGFDKPLIEQFFRYLGDFFTGNLGYSALYHQPVGVLLANRIPESLGFTILPIVLGLTAGILLGIFSVRIRDKLAKGLIQILIILGISMPVFVVGLGFQYTYGFQLGLFPTNDPFLPASILFMLTSFLTTRQVRSNYLNKLEEKHILSNSLQVITNASVLLLSIILLEGTFGIHGFFNLFVAAISMFDYWVIQAVIFSIILLMVIILFLSNSVYTAYNHFLGENQSRIFTNIFGRTEQMVEESASYDLESGQNIKDFTFNRLKSPLTIIGLAIVVFTIIVAIFPQVLTPLTYDAANGVYIGSWDPPSVTHPLGQTTFGRDVLARLAYGVSTSINVCGFSVLMGIAIGVLFGYLSKVHRWVKELVLGLTVILFIIPSIAAMLLFTSILGRDISIIMSIMALYTIPGVALLISRGNYSLKLTAKKLIAYFPLFMVFNILLFEAIGFLGFSDPMFIQLGNDISRATMHLYDAPWASLWPGLALFVLVMGFVTLHYGLKEPIPIPISRSEKF